jgi:hypothetical protein
MGKNQSASGLTNVIQYDNNGNIAFVSGSTTLMQVSSSGAITTTGTISGGAAADALLLNGTGSLAFVTTASYNVASSSFSSRTTQVERTYATTGSNTFTGPQYASNTSNAISFTSTASLYSDGGLRVQGNSFVSGTAYFNNIVVYGTSSIQYITSSQVNVGTNIITVNTDTPAVRFGGLAVFDSGSTQLTGSILWDSEKNHWVYSNPSGSSYSGGMLISGPRSSALGSEQGTTSCMLLVGQGGDHLTSSQIYHDSNRTCFNGNTILACSNNIGSDLNSRQTFTGSVVMTGSLLVNGLGTFSYNDNAYQGLIIRNINVGNAALAGLAIQNSSGTIVAQMNYVSTVYANTTLRDTFLFNTVAAQKLAFGTNSGGGGTRADIYFSVNPAFTLDSNNPNQIHIVGCTKNVIINYSGTDCSQKFQVNGTALITGVASFSSAICTPNLISTDATNTTLRIGCAIVPLANYRTTDCGYGGIDFFDNGKGYQCAAKFYTFKSISTAEFYGLTNDYNGSAQLSLVSCGGGAGNNISFFTGTSNVAKMRIDNCATCITCQLSIGPSITIGNQGGTDTTVIGGGSGVGSLLRMNYAGGSYNNYLAGNGDNYFNCLLGKLNAAGGVKFGGGATTLNYYEEGSWTPALQNATVSYAQRSGTYVRMGNWVFVRWGFQISTISGQSGTVTISGLPFTAANYGSYQEPNISVSTGNLATADNAQRARVYKGNSDTSLFGRITNNGDTPWETNQLQNGTWIIGEIFYNV